MRKLIAGLLGALVAGLLSAPGALGATITPNTLSDGFSTNGNCTLREAVQAANTNTAVDSCVAGSATKKDTIDLAAGHYKVTIDGENEDDNLTGDLDVDDGGPLAFVGNGQTVTFIDADDASIDDRPLELLGGDGAVSLADLTVSAGDYAEFGGVIRAVSGKVTFDHTTLTGGLAQFGGDLYALSEEVVMKDSLVSAGSARVTSTGFPLIRAAGGGIYVQGSSDVQITHSAIDNNDVFANDSKALGGGIAVAGGSVTVDRSTVSNNTAYSSTNSTAASSQRRGGGIYADGGTLNMVNSTVANNTANQVGQTSVGGGVFIDATASVTVDTSTIANNVATQGTAFAAYGGEITSRGSILDGAAVPNICVESGGLVTTKGWNVIDPAPNGTCMDDAPSAKDEYEDAILGPLLNNGGGVATMPLNQGSVAIDLLPVKRCKDTGKQDERGVERPAGKQCDAGAYERTMCAGALVGTAFVYGTPGKDKYKGGPAASLLFAPSAGNDKVTGTAGPDVLCGGTGKDKLKGGKGEDILDGGKDKDVCDGGPGNDTAKACEVKKSI